MSPLTAGHRGRFSFSDRRVPPHLDTVDQAPVTGWLPPQDIDTEVALLSVMMLASSAIEAAADVGVTPGDFVKLAHQYFASAIFDVFAEAGTVDPLLVIDRLRRDGTLELTGGELAVLAVAQPNPLPAVSLARKYAHIVRDLAVRREVIHLLSEANRAAFTFGDLTEPIAKLGEVQARRIEVRQRLMPGSHLLDGSSVAESSVWGTGNRVAWTEGEALLIVSKPGVGKTTLCGQLVAARIGVIDRVLGFPVRPTSSRVLYLAMDRPKQIMRALARAGQLGRVDRDLLDERLAIWSGPLPSLVTNDEHVLASLARSADADTLVVDSLKDCAAGLNSDEHGMAIDHAMQRVLAAGVELLVSHHHRKDGDPTTLEAVYGSAFITGGAGSVLSMWAKADSPDESNPRVSVKHLKTPADDLAVDEIGHDPYEGTSVVLRGQPDVIESVNRAGCLTAEEFAIEMTGQAPPSTNTVRKARRLLERAADAGEVRRVPGGPQPGGGRYPARYCMPPADGS